MRSALVGAVESTAVALEAMVGAGAPPVFVGTLPVERRARHSDFVDLRPTAAAAGIPVVDIVDVNAETTRARLRDAAITHLFVIGWSQILKAPLLATASVGAIGYHPAALPAMRGRAVIPWTILSGAGETGGSLFWLDEGVDSGDLLVQERFPVPPEASARVLYDLHLEALRRMLDRILPALRTGATPRVPQNRDGVSYCAKRTAADGVIDWTGTAASIVRLIRAVGDPYPGAWTLASGRRLTVWEATITAGVPNFAAAGQVVGFEGDGVVVMAGDGGLVRVGAVSVDDGPRVAPTEVIRMHDRLGVSPGLLISHLMAGSR